MREPEGPPWAHVELVVDGLVVGRGALDPALACDLRLVDLLFQLRNEACRQGEVLRISAVQAHLRELVELVGLGRHIEPARGPDDQASAGSSMRMGRPNSGNSSG